MTLEKCCACDEPTGRAGRCDDSLFMDDDGPFCEACFEATIQSAAEGVIQEADQLRSHNDALRAELATVKADNLQMKKGGMNHAKGCLARGHFGPCDCGVWNAWWEERVETLTDELAAVKAERDDLAEQLKTAEINLTNFRVALMIRDRIIEKHFGSLEAALEKKP